MTSSETLNYISHQLNIYIGIIIFILGVSGCLWNILIFRHYSFRLSSCCIYMQVGSLASLIQIFFGLIPRIVTEGFQYDLTITNIAWCKIRNYTTVCASLTALSCFIWTAIDRFFSTCRQIKWRYLNSIFIAKQLCLLTIIFWMILNLPVLIYTQPIESRRACISSSVIWSKFSIYFLNLFCYGIFPWFFMSLFGILTLKNLHQRIHPLSPIVITRMGRIDHQLTSMLFLQIIIAVLSSIPYCIQNIYDNLTLNIDKTKYRQAQENLFLQIVRLAFYLNYISMFYVNYISSPIFRRVSKKVLKNLHLNKDNISREITIINHQDILKLKRNQSKISTIQIPYRTSPV